MWISETKIAKVGVLPSRSSGGIDRYSVTQSVDLSTVLELAGQTHGGHDLLGRLSPTKKRTVV